MSIQEKVKWITLGCRVNQYETQGMREILDRAGFQSLAPEDPNAKESVHVVVINTCTVTADADRESQYWIRRARREYPHAKIVVTGCGVTRNRRADFEAMPEVGLVLENYEKAEIANRLLAGCATPWVQDEPPSEKISVDQNSSLRHQFTPLGISHTQGKGRAFVKIQDGCNHACSFCKVVLARGRSRSRPLKEIILEVLRLRDSGYREIVFAGIQLGAYGFDFSGSPAATLVEVIEHCAKIEGVERLRLSSIEPTDVRPELIEILASLPKCVPHMHIPLQSGDDEILKKMKRRYSRSFYSNLIQRLKTEIPDFALSLDVMAGFPGESDENFLKTLDLLEELKPVKCHVFPYSRREGTQAARLNGLSVQEIRRRVRILLEAADRLAREFKMSYLGRALPVLVEQVRDSQQEARKGSSPSGMENSSGGLGAKFRLLQGLSPNFIKVNFWGEEQMIGHIVPVQLLSIEGDLVLGERIIPN